jgi:hypothetical protein
LAREKRPERKRAGFQGKSVAEFLRRRRAMPWEMIIGRGLACCLHPLAAWRVCTRAGRALVVAVYASASFAATLAILLWRN